MFIFVLFLHRTDKYSTNLTINEKSIDGMLGSQTRAAEWKAQTNPPSYGGTPLLNFLWTHFTEWSHPTPVADLKKVLSAFIKNAVLTDKFPIVKH